MGSSATVTTSNMELTPCRVSFGTSGSEVDLGGTLGNVKITMKYMKADILADQHGKTVLDRSVNGTEVMVEMEVAEIKDKDLWAVVFPHATTITGAGGAKAIDFKTNLGDKDSAHAKSLVLHPLSMNDSDKSQDHNFAKACASAESELVYSPDGQCKLKLVFRCYPDSAGKIYRFGDAALVAV